MVAGKAGRIGVKLKLLNVRVFRRVFDDGFVVVEFGEALNVA